MSNHEAHLQQIGERKSRGAYYTPADVVDGILQLCLDPQLAELERVGPDSVAAIRVLDPTCGTGNFLIAAFERIRASLLRCGATSEEASELALNCVVGVDLDPEAVQLCRAALGGMAPGAKAGSVLARNIRCADSLLMPLEAPHSLFMDDKACDWAILKREVGAPRGFDVVLGNPPFLNQLHSSTAFTAEYGQQVHTRFGQAARGFTDPAALFLLVGLDVLRSDGGRLCLVEPLSVLSVRGAAKIRRALLGRAALTAAWFAEVRVFEDADVEVWAPVLETGAGAGPVKLFSGRTFEPFGTAACPDATAPGWGSLLAQQRGVPTHNWRTAGTLGEIASATADFRDQYYGLVGHVFDDVANESDQPKLVTSGLIDPAHLLWGNRATRFNREAFQAPRVKLSGLSPELRQWAAKRLVPKVLVATQTRVLEPIVDMNGSMLPSVPVLTIEAPVGSLWGIAALLISPPISAIAASRHFGAALSSDALKLSARDVLALPLPHDKQLWARAATAFKAASAAQTHHQRQRELASCAQLMCGAYGVEDCAELFDWWAARLPGAAAGARNRAIQGASS